MSNEKKERKKERKKESMKQVKRKKGSNYQNENKMMRCYQEYFIFSKGTFYFIKRNIPSHKNDEYNKIHLFTN